MCLALFVDSGINPVHAPYVNSPFGQNYLHTYQLWAKENTNLQIMTGNGEHGQ